MEREIQKGEKNAGMEASVEGPSLDKDGLFKCHVQTAEDRKDNFKNQVKKMQLHGDPTATTARHARGNEDTETITILTAAQPSHRQHETICLN